VRRNQFVVMGPWGHGVGARKVGELDFGEGAAFNLGELQFKWFEYWLKGRATGVENWPALKIFVMGENRWRAEHEWPLQRTKFTSYYLHSAGRANTAAGDGELSTEAPAGTATDTFLYDPRRPVPSLGGRVMMPSTANAAGPVDQRPAEARDDVLCFTSPLLTEPLEVTGHVSLTLFASSSAPDTDFTGKLVDVFPDGRAIFLTDGILRARYRNSLAEPEPLTPGELYELGLDLSITSNVFLPGHRIRLEVSSSNFPR